MSVDPYEMKYEIKLHFKADGVVEKSDIIGAIFGQTEGLLGEEMNLRELQKSARVGRIEVEFEDKKGKSEGTVFLPASLDKVETCVLAAALETIDRIGPCKSHFVVSEIEDVRGKQRETIIDRAKALLAKTTEAGAVETKQLIDSVRESLRMEELISIGPERLPAGPNVKDSDAVLIVEGRSDVLNLLKHGIKNAIAVEGTNIPESIVEICKEKIVTAFVDGDRGGELILKELLQIAEVDFVARAPPGKEVEELTEKQIMKSLKNKIPTEQYVEMAGIKPIEKIRKEENEKEKLERLASGINNTFTSVLLDKEGNIIKNGIPVHDLVETLKRIPNVDLVLFDGVITQRLVEVAQERHISKIIGVKKAQPLDVPGSIKVLTKDEI
jgi:DNA primase